MRPKIQLWAIRYAQTNQLSLARRRTNGRIVVFASERHRVHVYEFVPNDKIHRNDDYVEGVPVPGNENHCNISFLILLHSKPCNPLMIIVTSF